MRDRLAASQELPSLQEVDPIDAHLARTIVTSTAQRLTDRARDHSTVYKMSTDLISHLQQYHGLLPVRPSPINDFNTEGYILCAFPTLFPTEAADFVALWSNAVTIGNCFKHLLRYVMVGLPSTLGSAILYSTLSCAGMLFTQAESMFINTLMMLDCLWKS